MCVCVCVCVWDLGGGDDVAHLDVGQQPVALHHIPAAHTHTRTHPRTCTRGSRIGTLAPVRTRLLTSSRAASRPCSTAGLLLHHRHHAGPPRSRLTQSPRQVRQPPPARATPRASASSLGGPYASPTRRRSHPHATKTYLLSESLTARPSESLSESLSDSERLSESPRARRLGASARRACERGNARQAAAETSHSR